MTKTEEAVEKELKTLREFLASHDLTLQVIWTDEYGGSQSVTLNSYDQLKVVKKRGH